MKTYHGKRTKDGCEVTVDGRPLERRADLSGNASSDFDWGFIGNGQLSIALLSDFLGDDPKARAMCESFERKVVAELPHRSWILSGQDLANALDGLIWNIDPVAVIEDSAAGAAFGDMPVESAIIAAPQEIVESGARPDSTQPQSEGANSQAKRATALKGRQVAAAAGELAEAANQVAEAAMAVGVAAHQVAHVGDGPADETMSTANRAADRQADATNRVVDAAAALAQSAAEDANRIAANLFPV